MVRFAKLPFERLVAFKNSHGSFSTVHRSAALSRVTVTAAFFLGSRSYSEKVQLSSRTFWGELQVFSATATIGPLTAVPVQRLSSFVKKIGEPSSFAIFLNYNVFIKSLNL